ncbi:GGDEF domain-containing protein [Desulfovibrio sp. OttesenSCG-928-A18]|nr:GGDEF domain-containing protein [Desulfovibrio sp. OttesenSCG-928-A18]
MSRECAASGCLWSENDRFCEVLEQASVPLDAKWPLTVLYLRGVRDMHFLSEVQKSEMQELLLALLREKDFSDQRYTELQSAIFAILTEPLNDKLQEIARETTALAHDITSMFGKHQQGVINAASTVETELASGKAPAMILARLRDTLKVVVSQMEEDASVLASLSKNDSLTGLANRRFLDDFLAESVEQWQKRDVPVSLILFDIDEFKKFNDTYGHLVGDQVLRTLAGLVQKIANSLCTDTTQVLAARYGGEEFALVIRGEAASRAVPIAENLRKVIQKTSLLLRDADNNVLRSGIRVSVSLGLAKMWGGWKSALVTNLVDCADKALYTAKRNGRNCTVYHTPEKDLPYTVVDRD